MGAASPNHVLNHGDRLRVVLRGQINKEQTVTIDREGRILVEGLPPILAAGRTLAELESALDTLSQRTPNLNIFVSLDRVRQIDVLVIGNVNRPGRQNLTPMNSVMDALLSAEGIKKTGSLRRVKLVRGGHSSVIDLYDMLTGNASAADRALQDGDRIIVPPIGPTIALAGSVVRPGIYELPAHQSQGLQTMNSVLELAGGPINVGQNRFIMITTTPRGQDMVVELNDFKKPTLPIGSILKVERGREMRAGMVDLSGATRRAGLHALTESASLEALLGDPQAFTEDTYPLLGFIIRKNGTRLFEEILSFSPQAVLDRRENITLLDNDRVLLLTHDEIAAYLSNAPVQQGNANAFDPRIAQAVHEHATNIHGEVLRPGTYAIAKQTAVRDLVDLAGGPLAKADLEKIEVSRTTVLGQVRHHYALDSADLPALNPGDSVRINPEQGQKQVRETVLIRGEVMRPGRYDLMPGDTYSELLARAGGLTEQAYPSGTIFSRASERRAEEERFRAAARDMERSVAEAMAQSGDRKPDDGQISMARELAGELKEAEGVGRLTIEGDPALLFSRPEQDILLEGGDRIFVPRRPSTVRVRGEVLSPANLKFESGKRPSDYITEAGGMTHYADQGRAFVLYPDGSAAPLKGATWRHSKIMVPPGSTIIVPRDPKPFDFIDSAGKLTQIFANLALTGVFIDELQDDD